MRVVAEHLVKHCGLVKDPTDRDHFARSAFNRSYYATYLTIRTSLARINPKWDTPTHSEVPNLLRKSVVMQFERRARGHLMSPSDSAKTKNKGCTAAKALADLMEQGNRTRKIADYEPAMLVKFDGPLISLGGLKATTALQWCRSAETQCQVLINAAEKFGLC